MKHDCILSLLALLFTTSTASAGTYTIEFGLENVGEEGAGYAPNYLFLKQSDVIVWKGDFAKYPLHFDAVPDDAPWPADITTGNTFSYSIRKGGIYHFSSPAAGISGMIAARAEQISVEREWNDAGLKVYPNPVVRELHLQCDDDQAQVENCMLISASGVVYRITAVAGANGSFTLSLHDLHLSAGAFTLQFTKDGSIYRRRIQVN